MRRFIATFLVTLVAILGLIAVGPLPGEWAREIYFASFLALGVVAALIGRGLSGLLAFYLGLAATHPLAVLLGFFSAPSGESDLVERLYYFALGSFVGTVGYLGPVLVRALLRLTRPRH